MPSRLRLTLAAAAAVAALVAAAPATAHPSLTPASVSTGASTRVVAGIPNEREGRATVSFSLTFPPGFTVERAEDTGRWVATVEGRTVSWRGGRIEGATSVDFALDLRADAPTDTYQVALDQRYDDGRSVRTTASIAVLPAIGDAAPDQHVGRAIVAAVVGVVLVLATLVGLRALRRRQAPR